LAEVEITHLYGGEVCLEYNDRAHTYHVIEGEERRKVPSVTRICSVIDKPWLIPWAVNSAVNLCKGAVSPDVAHSDLYLEQVWKQATSAYRSVRDEALNVGKEVHSFLEKHLKSTEKPLLPAEGTAVRSCVDAALAWLREHEVRLVEVERRIYSRRHRFSGTLDKLAYVDGELTLIDWKTSKSLYDEYWLQTSAYQAAYEEETQRRIEKRILIRLDKEAAVFEDHASGRREYRQDFQAFLGALKLFKRLHMKEKNEETI